VTLHYGEPPVVVVIGDANPDLVLGGDTVPRFGQAEQLLDSADLVLGGSAAIVACGLARLGVPTALVTSLGDDLFGTFVRGELTEAGVNTRWVTRRADVPTGVTVVLSGQGRALLTHPGTIGLLRRSDVPGELLAVARHVHVASYFLQPGLAAELPALFAQAHGAGTTASLDTNWDPAERWDGVRDVLPYVDVLLPNAAELLALAGTGGAEDDPAALERAARSLGSGRTTIALKAGRDGGVVWTPDRQRFTAPIRAVDVVDTTGAGDSFNAGYLSGYVEGLSSADCLSRAVACGSLSTRAAGGTAAQPTRAELAAELSGGGLAD